MHQTLKRRIPAPIVLLFFIVKSVEGMQKGEIIKLKKTRRCFPVEMGKSPLEIFRFAQKRIGDSSRSGGEIMHGKAVAKRALTAL